MANMVPSTVKQYAREDIADAIALVKDIGHEPKIIDERFEAYRAGDIPGEFSVDAIFTLKDEEGKQFEFPIEYVVKGDDVYVGYDDISDLARSLQDRWNEAIVSSTKVRNKRRIVAADEEFGLEESVGDLADSVTELQDSVEDIDEDSPNIETDNNISDHYIAQCDACNGIFVSALIESDQDVNSIQGICPVCGKESEQVIHWIVRDLDYVPDLAEVASAQTDKMQEQEFQPEAEAAPAQSD